MFKKTAALFYLTMALSFNLAAAPKTVSISGSTSVSRIMDALAETFNKRQSDIFIAVHGTGSSAGITAVKNGATELGMSSRFLKDEEASPNLKLVEIAHDAIAMVVHPSNPINNLTAEHANAIYKRQITDWSELGDEPSSAIAAVSRENASGTRFSFESNLDLLQVINGITVSGINNEVLIANSNSMVKTIVNHNPHAIGYISLGSVDNSIKAVSFNGIAPTLAHIHDNKYNLTRPFLIMYKDGELSTEARQFIQFILSEDGQDIVEAFGYLPIKQPS
ncbi:phosphate ABC transporter substrate-binding protein [Thaumasiovibrio sp. DFM-14]|uniref:phosphate ABC transporter substrate-binding protein n=1 Tax=Thaumasiovibrio sp. DFM-14 TaxID=3384792 RepID=UPI0039A1D545